MHDRESFLRAIFSNPNDDLPRLVFADYLQENGDENWAELIRVQCELAAKSGVDANRQLTLQKRESELVSQLYPGYEGYIHSGLLCNPAIVVGGAPRLAVRPYIHRGFLCNPVIRVSVDELSDPDAFRRDIVQNHPEWYCAARLEITEGRITTPDILATILSSPVTEYVTELNLSGCVEEIEASLEDDSSEQILPVYDLENKPVITVRMVEALAQMRECRRLVELDLRNNDLDNDAVRALANSPHLFRLKRLYLLNGNRFKGRTWQASVERFGPDVVQ